MTEPGSPGWQRRSLVGVLAQMREKYTAVWPVPVMRSMLSPRDSLRMMPTSAEARGVASARRRHANGIRRLAARIRGATAGDPLVGRRAVLRMQVGKQPPRARKDLASL